MRREGDSNPRYAFGVYTLSRRASSTTRAPLQSPGSISSHKCILFFLLLKHYHFFILHKSFKLIYFKTLKFIFGNSKHFQSILTCSFRNEIIFFIVYLTQFSYHLAHIGTFISFTPIRHRS